MNNRFCRTLACAFIACLSFAASACDDDNNYKLSALRMPGDIHIVSRCYLQDQIVDKSETECAESGGLFANSLYAVNQSTASVAFINYYPNKSEFEAIDITASVPGVTSIPVGDRPQSISGDSLGAFVVVTSSVNNELSIISVNDYKEIAYQQLDKKPFKIVYHKNSSAFLVFFYDGTVRKLTIDFDCGAGENVFPANCSLNKDKITVKWENAVKLDGTPAGFVADPEKNVGYVSYSDRRYISVIGFDDAEGSCLSSSAFPCEIERLGAGFGCADGIDNDGNGLIDEQDASCFYPWSIEGGQSDSEIIQAGYTGIGECNDGIDNSGSGLVDALDPGCVSSSDASESESGWQAMQYGTCGNASDDDGDGDADRADIKCAWPTDDEDPGFGSASLGFGLCRDGVDNDQNGLTDTEDIACYGPNGLSETPIVSSGRGAVDVDPLGRWLYVLDPVDSQLIVVDLATKQTIDRSGWFPRNRTVGIPVSRLALDVVADIRQENLYSSGAHTINSERAVAFVSSSGGVVTEYSIFQTLKHYVGDTVNDSIDEMIMLPTDTDGGSSYVGTVRCVGKICADSDLPVISLRQRNVSAFFPKAGIISNIDPDTNEYYTIPYDAIIASETWRITYEGALDIEKRGDGYFSSDGKFNTNVNLCTIGARPGDHLILRNRKGVQPISAPQCLPFLQNSDGSEPVLEWEITNAGPNSLTLAPTGTPGYVESAPFAECFTTGLDYEIRPSGQWLITSKSTYVNRRMTIGTQCVDNPLNPYGQTRFGFDPASESDIAAKANAQTAFFSVKMPTVQRQYARDEMFEFTTRTGQSSLSFGVAAAPIAMKLFKNAWTHFLLVSEASANTVVFYDIDAEGIDDTL